MFYALSWFLLFGLFALWSLAAWAFHALVGWTVANAGALADRSGSIDALRVPEWLAPWVPPELVSALASMLTAFAPAVETMLASAPALSGVLSVAVWVTWAIGSALLVLIGIALTGAIAFMRRRSSANTGPSRAAGAAG